MVNVETFGRLAVRTAVSPLPRARDHGVMRAPVGLK
jgi:hypothetical protein